MFFSWNWEEILELFTLSLQDSTSLQDSLMVEYMSHWKTLIIRIERAGDISPPESSSMRGKGLNLDPESQIYFQKNQHIGLPAFCILGFNHRCGMLWNQSPPPGKRKKFSNTAVVSVMCKLVLCPSMSRRKKAHWTDWIAQFCFNSKFVYFKK